MIFFLKSIKKQQIVRLSSRDFPEKFLKNIKIPEKSEISIKNDDTHFENLLWYANFSISPVKLNMGIKTKSLLKICCYEYLASC